MKKAFKHFGLIALAAVIGFSFTACSDGGGGGGGGDPLANQFNGTWTAGDGTAITLNNGSFVIAENNKQGMRGTYTAATRSISATIAMAVKELHGDYLNELLEEFGLDIYNISNWYTKTQVTDALRKWMKDAGVTDTEINNTINGQSAAFDAMYPTITGTIDGDTMIVNGTTFTKNGGSTQGTGGGGGYAGTYTLNPGKDRTTFTLNAAGDWRFDVYDNNLNLYYFTGEQWRASGNEITLYYLGNNVYATLTIVNSTTLEWYGELFRKQ